MNRLAGEKSPYLLQHKDNPVDWLPWGEEAFARARAEDKPIFLSVGYSTCHWCHVMERESFENPDIAKIMNAHFVNVKVDREERPDVDRVYMAFVQATTGGGGWPMSVFLTPDLEPFFGGTYFPPDNRYGRPGFPSLLERVAQLWRERRDALRDAGQRVIAQMRDAEHPPAAGTLDESTFRRASAFFHQAFDREHAGFGQAPKFPRPSTHNFLLRCFAAGFEDTNAKMVVATLHLMSRGGMYDHLGGGFHRYSVDRYWHVPHFEKMLYDQAQLVQSLVEAYQITGDAQLARVARETCDYVLRDLGMPGGGFASAEDADSEAPGAAHKIEGAFYVWTAAEIEALLPAGEADIFSAYYGVEPEGNADDPHGELTGKNVLHAIASVEEIGKRFAREPAEVEAILERGRRLLFEVRARRPRPHRDDKTLTSWNGLMIGALAQAGAAFGEPRYVEAAAAAADFVRRELMPGDRLLRRFRDGEAAIDGYLDDHAFLACGLLDLYEAGGDPRWLELAETVTARLVARFRDAEGGGFFTTPGDDPSVLLRMKDDYDGAEPAGASMAVLALLRLSELAGRSEWRAVAEETLNASAARLREAPHAMPQMLVAALLARRPGVQVVLAGERDDPAVASLAHAVHERFLPERTLIFADAAARARTRMPWIAAMGPVDGKAAAYLCRDHACDRPTTEPAQLAASLPKVTLETVDGRR